MKKKDMHDNVDRILEIVGKDKVKDYSKWQLQCLAFRIRTELEELKRIIDKT